MEKNIPSEIMKGLSKEQIEYIQSLQNQLRKTNKEKQPKTVKQPTVKKTPKQDIVKKTKTQPIVEKPVKQPKTPEQPIVEKPVKQVKTPQEPIVEKPVKQPKTPQEPIVEKPVNQPKQPIVKKTKTQPIVKKPVKQPKKQPVVKKPKTIRKTSINIVANLLGFKKPAFIRYLQHKRVDLSKFRNELELLPYMKKIIADDKNLVKTIKKDGFEIKPLPVNRQHVKKSISKNYSLIAEKLGFENEYELQVFMEDNRIDPLQFENVKELYLAVKKQKANLKKDKEIIKNVKETGYLEDPFKVKPSEEEDKFWVINKPTDPTQLEEINQMIEEERKKYGESSGNKSFQMIFNNNITCYKDIIYTLTDLYKQMPTMFRILFSFGVIQESHNTDKDTKKENYTYSTFRPGKNNFFLERNEIIKNKQDFNHKVLFECTEKNIIEKLCDAVPDSQTRLIGVYAIGMKVTLLDFPIGSQIKLPNYIKKSKSIVSLEGIPFNLCFFGGIAIANGARYDRYLSKAKELFKNYYGDKKALETYPGFDFHKELDKYEKFNTKYAINILNYNEDKTANVVRHSPFNDDKDRKKIYINLYMDHFSYISNLTKLIKKYICETCGRKFKNDYDLVKHQEICSTEQIDVFAKYPQIYEPRRNTIKELAEWFGVEIDYKYDYLITYDLESLLYKVEEKHGEKTKITHKHAPISVSVYDNIYSQEYWYSNTDPKRIVYRLFKQLDRLCEKASKLMLKKMKPLTDVINNYYHKKRRDRYLKQIEDYCSSVPIIGFNSGFYDTGIMINNNFMQEILKRDKNPIVAKDGNRYKFIKAGKFLFLDEATIFASNL